MSFELLATRCSLKRLNLGYVSHFDDVEMYKTTSPTGFEGRERIKDVRYWASQAVDTTTRVESLPNGTLVPILDTPQPIPSLSPQPSPIIHFRTRKIFARLTPKPPKEGVDVLLLYNRDTVPVIVDEHSTVIGHMCMAVGTHENHFLTGPAPENRIELISIGRNGTPLESGRVYVLTRLVRVYA